MGTVLPVKAEHPESVKKLLADNPISEMGRLQDRQNEVDRLYVHTGPNPKIKRCQAGFNGKACPNEGMPATVGEYKAWLCFMHSSMGKLVEA